jgi:hypothetical protein
VWPHSREQNDLSHCQDPNHSRPVTINIKTVVCCRYFAESYDYNKMGVMHDIAFFRYKAIYLEKICQKKSRKKVFNCSGIDVVSAARAVRTRTPSHGLLFLALPRDATQTRVLLS